MAAENNGNGAGGVKQWTDTLTLHFDRTTHRLHLSGEVHNVDVALAMLAQATREYERQLRAQHAIQLQAELAQAARDQQIADAMRRGR